MEAILELLFTAAVEIIKVIKFKNPKTQIWVMTIILSLFFAFISGMTVWGAIALFKQGSTIGAILMAAIALVIAIVALILLIRGHKTNWKKY